MRRMRRALLTVPVALLVLVSVPSAALAGTVTSTGNDVRFTAARGEVNAVSVRSAPGELVVIDTGAPILAGPGCTQHGPEEARCAVAEGWTAVVDGGDGPDVLDAGRENVVLLGGHGDDRLIGGEMVDSSCGEGEGDAFAPADPSRIPPRTHGCERVRLAGRLFVGDLLSWSRRGVRLGTFTLARRMPVRIVLRHGDRRIGARRAVLRGAGRGQVTVRLNRAGKRLISRRGWLTVLVRRPGLRTVGFRVYLR